MHKVVILSNIESPESSDNLESVVVVMDDWDVDCIMYIPKDNSENQLTVMNRLIQESDCEDQFEIEVEFVGHAGEAIETIADFVEEVADDDTIILYHDMADNVSLAINNIFGMSGANPLSALNYNNTFINCENEKDVFNYMPEMKIENLDQTSLVAKAIVLATYVEVINQ